MTTKKHFLDKKGLQLCAHRGNCMSQVENTLPAFKQAISSGATMIECDLQLSKDGIVIVFHDSTLWRLCRSLRRGSSLCWKDLQQYKLLQKNNKKTLKGKMTSFEELLDTFGKNINYYAELKYHKHLSNKSHQELSKKVYEHVSSRKLLKNTLFVSFEKNLLNNIRNLDPKAYLGLNFANMADLKKHMPWVKKNIQALCPKQTLVNKNWLKEIHQQGYKVIPWVVNETDRMRELINMNINGITTDFIEQLVATSRP